MTRTFGASGGEGEATGDGAFVCPGGGGTWTEETGGCGSGMQGVAGTGHINTGERWAPGITGLAGTAVETPCDVKCKYPLTLIG